MVAALHALDLRAETLRHVVANWLQGSYRAAGAANPPSIAAK
jgi:hypothetical protein